MVIRHISTYIEFKDIVKIRLTHMLHLQSRFVDADEGPNMKVNEVLPATKIM